MKILNIIAISALIVGAPPLVSDFLPGQFADSGAAFAKNDGKKGGKKDKARGNSSRQNGNSGKASNAGSRSANASAAVVKPTNVHAQLKGLNSLNRNINGLMNSSDPKMDGVREFVVASAEYQATLDALATEYEGFDADGSYQVMLEDLGLTMPTSPEEFVGLAEQLSALANAPAPLESDFVDEAAYLEAHSDWEGSTAGAADALSQYEGSDLYAAAADAEAAEAASSEEAMIAAMVAGLNATGAGPVTVEDMSPEMIEWVAAQLGVGETDGLIDAYLAQLAEMVVEDAEPEVGESDI